MHPAEIAAKITERFFLRCMEHGLEERLLVWRPPTGGVAVAIEVDASVPIPIVLGETAEFKGWISDDDADSVVDQLLQ